MVLLRATLEAVLRYGGLKARIRKTQLTLKQGATDSAGLRGLKVQIEGVGWKFGVVWS